MKENEKKRFVDFFQSITEDMVWAGVRVALLY